MNKLAAALFVVLVAGACAPARQVPAGHVAYDTQENYQRLVRVLAPIAIANAAYCKESGLGVVMTPDGQEACAISAGVSKAADFNAATDGTNIFITRPMLAFLRTDDELAFIFCHELAHIVRDHITEKRIGSAIGSFFDGALAGQGVNTGGAFQRIGVTVYNRDREREADRVAAYMMARAKFNPRAAADLWDRMPPGEGGWLATHPLSADRAAAIREFARDIEIKQSIGAAVFVPR